MLTGYYITHNIIAEEKRKIYEYGFEILISTIFYSIYFVILAILTKTTVESLFFLSGFFIIRTIAGGYHTNSYFSCHLLSIANHLFFILFLKICPDRYFDLISLSLNILSILMIFIFAPVDHVNKPFIKEEEQRFRKYSIIYSIFLFVITIIYFIAISDFENFFLSFSIGTFSAVFALMSAKIKKIKEKK